MTELWAICFALLAAACAGLGPIWLKRGAVLLDARSVLIGYAWHGLGFLMYAVALKGGQLSVMYPITSFQYVFSAFLASRLFGEKITALKAAAIAMIVLGITVISAA